MESNEKRMKSNKLQSSIKLVVCGRVHEVGREILSRFPGTLLAKISGQTTKTQEVQMTSSELDSVIIKADESNTLYIRRNYACFEAILDYFYTGELHMPKNLCPRVFQKELIFWNISPDKMEDCCRFPFIEFFDRQNTVSKFSQILSADDFLPESHWGSGRLGRARRRIWLITENMEKSLPAQMYMWFMILCVICSVITLSCGTVDSLNTKLDGCQFVSYVQSLAQDSDYEDLEFISDIIDCSWSHTDIYEYFNFLYEHNFELGSGNDTFQDYTTWAEFSQEERTNIFDKVKNAVPFTKQPIALKYIDIALLAIFSLDMLIRLLTSPSLKTYFTSILNLIDIIVITCAICEIYIESKNARVKKDNKGFKILFYVQMFRVFRFYRYIRNFPATRVLRHTFKYALKDMGVIMLFLLIGVTIFANFFYFAEDDTNVPNIPKAWWWAVITMTTVGYGDVVPLSTVGRIISGICAFSGLILFALMIPIFVNNFLTFYQHSQIHEQCLTNGEEKTHGRKKSNSVFPEEQVQILHTTDMNLLDVKNLNN